jgi:hypothetical protein
MNSVIKKQTASYIGLFSSVKSYLRFLRMFFHRKNRCVLYPNALGRDTLGERRDMCKRFNVKFLALQMVAVLFLLSGISFVSDVRVQDSSSAVPVRLEPFTLVHAVERPVRPELIIVPVEFNLGQIGPGGVRKGSVLLQNKALESVKWALMPLSGWTLTDAKNLGGVVSGDSESLKFQLKIVNGSLQNANGLKKTAYSAYLMFEAGGQTSEYMREIKPGNYRERISLDTSEGVKSFQLLFKVLQATTPPVLSVDPLLLDFGVAAQGEKPNRRIRVANTGWEMLKWQAVAGGTASPDQISTAIPGRYISFLNEETTGSGHYRVPRHLKDRLELQGKWAEDRGYPAAATYGQPLRYHFTGTSIAVHFHKGPTTGKLTAFVGDRFVAQQEGFAEQKELFVWLVADGLSNDAHILTLVNENGPVTIEGLRVNGGDILRIPPENISISPSNGAVTRQTNYVNISVDTGPLPSGLYSGQFTIQSNGGQKDVALSLEVTADHVLRKLDVYRYIRDFDYFLTTNPQAEAAVLQTRGYVKQGIAFRLFSPGTPGTTEFYRWYHTQKGDHYYGYELAHTKRSMQGYVLEGTIGNIATSRLPQTRELYRWYHPGQENYFFTVDVKGEGMQKYGYQYDGIAGYVKP